MAKKAPGKHWRKGLTMVDLLRMFPNDETAERWFVETRWPDGVHVARSVAAITSWKSKAASRSRIGAGLAARVFL